MNDVLRYKINKYMFVYLDDILLTLTLPLRTHTTCQIGPAWPTPILAPSVNSTRTLSSSWGRSGKMEMDPIKASVVPGWPRLENRKELQHFLDLCQFISALHQSLQHHWCSATNTDVIQSSFCLGLQPRTCVPGTQDMLHSGLKEVLKLLDPNLQFIVDVNF